MTAYNYAILSNSDASPSADGMTFGEGDTAEVSHGGSITDCTFTNSATGSIVGNGVAAGTRVFKGAYLNVSGGHATETFIGSGGYEYVGSGVDPYSSNPLPAGYLGSDTGATISSGGEQDINGGGVANNAVVLAGGVQDLINDSPRQKTVATAITHNTIVSGGLQQIDFGTASNTVLRGSGIQQVNGGTAIFTHVSAGGSVIFGLDFGVRQAGAITSNVTVSSGGLQVAFEDGSQAAFYNPDGTEALLVTSAAGKITINYETLLGSAASDDGDVFTEQQVGGEVYASFYNASSGETYTASAAGYINLANAAVNTTVLSGGTFEFEGATVTNLTVMSGGRELVGGDFKYISGGVYSYPGGITVDQTGTYLTSNLISNGVTEIVSSGGTTARSTVLSGGIEQVSAGGSATTTFVNVGGSSTVFSGGFAGGTVVSTGAGVVVSAGGIASGIILQAGATAIISGMGIAPVLSGGVLLAANAGFVISAHVLGGVDGNGNASGGVLQVSGTGRSLDTLISAGGFEIVSAGGISTSATVSDGIKITTTGAPPPPPEQIIAAQGSGSAATVGSGGIEVVSNGGIATSATISSGGVATISAGGSATMFIVSSGGTEFLDPNGYDSGATISSGGIQIASGLTSNVTISMGGSQTVLSGGNALFDIVGSGGFVNVSAGGQTASALLNTAATLKVYASGRAVNTVVNGGTETVSSGGKSVAAIVKSGGTEAVLSSGVASFTQVSAGGQLAVDLGGVVMQATVLSGAAPVIANGLANSSTVSAFGTLTASGGLRATPGEGQIANTIVRQDGQDIVIDGGVARKTQLVGGTEIVSAGGIAYTTSVATTGSQVLSNGGSGLGTQIADGTQVVLAGGYASGAIVASYAGGSQVVSADGIADNTQDGGLVQIVAGGLERSLFVASNGSVQLSGGTISSASVAAGGSITGFGTTQGMITNGGTITASGGTLDLTDGVAGTTAQGQFVVDAGATLLVSGNVTARDIHILAGGTAVLNGQTLNTDPIEIDAGGTLIGYGTISGAFTNGGSVTASGGVLTVADAFTGSGTLGAEGGGTLTFEGSYNATGPVQVGGTVSLASIAGGQNFDFTGSGATLSFGAEAGSSTLVGFDQNDILDLRSQPGLFVSSSGDALTIQSADNMPVAVFVLSGQPSGTIYDVTPDGNGGTRIEALSPAVACFCHGTRIRTPDGDVAVERLAIGDLVMTAGRAVRPVRWVGRRRYAGRFLAANPNVQPIRFRATSLGDDLPNRDLLVSPEHAMFLDGLLIPARCLVNATTIIQERGLDQVDYVHIELDSHDIILAEGAPSESYLDDSSRGMFHNASEFAALYPDREAPRCFCAPKVDEGYELEVIRRRLAVVAGELAAAA